MPNFPAPRPEDFNTPGMVTPEEMEAQRARAFAPPPRPPVDAAVPTGLVGGVSQQAWAPIQEIGAEYTYHIVVPDNRPHVVVPLNGPGAYQITVIRRAQ